MILACYDDSMCHVVVFFFKQKTAYEMRISDWSSDVCSSDLVLNAGGSVTNQTHTAITGGNGGNGGLGKDVAGGLGGDGGTGILLSAGGSVTNQGGITGGAGGTGGTSILGSTGNPGAGGAGIVGKNLTIINSRSEEHTSELQSLMPSSYAVFCL